MPAAKITSFSGMIPALDDVALPDTAASYAQNTVMGDGTVRGTRPMVLLHIFKSATTKKVYRIPNAPDLKPTSDFANSTWWEFPDFDTDVLRTPVVNDIFDRYYWVAPGKVPRYSSLSRIQSGGETYRLGMPTPVPPLVEPIGGTPDPPAPAPPTIQVTRAYTYTWVSAFGEEGPPAIAAVKTGKVDASWRITMAAPSGVEMTDRFINQTRLYRTVVSASGVASYFQVATFGIGQTVYVDVLPDSVVSSHSQLESINWTPPPLLEGWVAMPNGIFAGWQGNDVWFSEPFRPHAWPVAYGMSCDAPIVGLGVHGQSLIVLTKGNLHVISGVRPAQMTQAKIDSKETCLARASIVSTLDGVTYASQNGIAMASAGGVRLITDKLIDKEMWLKETDPYTLRAVKHGTSYLAFNAPGTTGPGLRLGRPPETFNWVFANDDIQNIWTDVWTGETMVTHSGRVWHWDPSVPADDFIPFVWKSKLFEFPAPHNFASAKIRFTIAKPLTFTLPPSTNINMTLTANMYAIFRAYANEKLVFAKELRESNKTFRLPSGFKTIRWQFEIEGRVIVHSMEVATSARELAKV